MADSPRPKPLRPSVETVIRHLDAARTGDRDAIFALLNLYHDYLTSIARQDLDRRLRSKGSASDLVQETLTVALRKFPSQKIADEEALRFWLRKLLKHKLKNFQRKYGPGTKRDLSKEVPLDDFESKRFLFELAVQMSDSPGEKYGREELIKRLHYAIDQLPAGRRQIILWHYRDHRTFVEIAAALDRKPDAVRMACQRAMKSLHAQLFEGDGDAQ